MLAVPELAIPCTMLLEAAHTHNLCLPAHAKLRVDCARRWQQGRLLLRDLYLHDYDRINRLVQLLEQHEHLC